VCQFAGLARFHCKTKFFNATGAGILGVNHFDSLAAGKHILFPWVKQIDAQKAIEMFE
jgi:hypothetical protein